MAKKVLPRDQMLFLKHKLPYIEGDPFVNSMEKFGKSSIPTTLGNELDPFGNPFAPTADKPFKLTNDKFSKLTSSKFPGVSSISSATPKPYTAPEGLVRGEMPIYSKIQGVSPKNINTTGVYDSLKRLGKEYAPKVIAGIGNEASYIRQAVDPLVKAGSSFAANNPTLMNVGGKALNIAGKGLTAAQMLTPIPVEAAEVENSKLAQYQQNIQDSSSIPKFNVFAEPTNQKTLLQEQVNPQNIQTAFQLPNYFPINNSTSSGDIKHGIDSNESSVVHGNVVAGTSKETPQVMLNQQQVKQNPYDSLFGLGKATSQYDVERQNMNAANQARIQNKMMYEDEQSKNRMYNKPQQDFNTWVAQYGIQDKPLKLNFGG